MRVAVIDVGSNTVRLLVAEETLDGAASVHQHGLSLGLGAEVELRERICSEKLEEAAFQVRELVREARGLGCALIEVVVASPGRQAENGDELIRLLARAAGVPVRLLSAEEEAGLAFRGAVEASRPKSESIAVCDVGGGSTQIGFGEPRSEPVWVRSVDVGSLRLTTRFLAQDLPGKRAVAEARGAVRETFAGLAVPLPKQAYAVGGSARALRKIAGARLGRDELREGLAILRLRNRAEICEGYGVSPTRARTLIGGALILEEVQRRLGVPLEVVRAGLREGVVAVLLEEAARLRPAVGDSAAG